MATKTQKGRFIQKHDTESNWNNARNFVPMAGEIIFYDPDSSNSSARMKIGDGETTVVNLDFFGGTSEEEDEGLQYTVISNIDSIL